MINKKEAIEFLIEECYKKFPELMKQISEEEMYKILDENISEITSGQKDKDASGLYFTETKEIQILNRGIVSLEDIKNDPDLIAVLVHESLHALFRKTKSKTRN